MVKTTNHIYIYYIWVNYNDPLVFNYSIPKWLLWYLSISQKLGCCLSQKPSKSMIPQGAVHGCLWPL